MYELGQESDDNKEIPRAKRANPYNYTPLQFAIRDKAIKDMSRDFTNIPYKWLEWLYDTVENKKEEEIDKIINDGLWEEPINKDRQTGGVLKGNCEIETPNDLSNNDLKSLDISNN